MRSKSSDSKTIIPRISRPPLQKRMTCWNCPRYNRAEFRCLDGKTNPRKKVDCVIVAEILGLRALCHYNLYRDILTQRTHYPNAPFTVDASARVVHKRTTGIVALYIGSNVEPDTAANMPK